jgi:hypothetical protein
MSYTVCVGCYTLRYMAGGAYMWMFLNWALGFQALGCRVIWLDSADVGRTPDAVARDVALLRRRLMPYGLDRDLSVIYRDGQPVPRTADAAQWRDLDAASSADLFVNLGYDLHPTVRKSFRRSAFVDIDPGLTQLWAHAGQLDIGSHDVYFTLGETVGQPGSRIPTCGVRWLHVPPPVFLPAWPIAPAREDAPYTTVSNWWDEHGWLDIGGTIVDNSKRSAFLGYLDLPSRTAARLELALPLASDDDPTADLETLTRYGWRVRHVLAVSGCPDAHRRYVQGSRGEFSCMKRGYRLLQTAWTGERAVNYLASGKPVIVEHTGPSRMLPDAEGLFRFRDPAEAAAALRAVESDYERHARAARALAETYFDAASVARTVVERAA